MSGPLVELLMGKSSLTVSPLLEKIDYLSLLNHSFPMVSPVSPHGHLPIFP
jgi:hypothetical protein